MNIWVFGFEAQERIERAGKSMKMSGLCNCHHILTDNEVIKEFDCKGNKEGNIGLNSFSFYQCFFIAIIFF